MSDNGLAWRDFQDKYWSVNEDHPLPVALMGMATGGLPVQVIGKIAHDAVASALENPLLDGGVATNNFQAAVANGDKVQAAYSLYGEKIITVGSASTVGSTDGSTNLVAFRGLTGSIGLLAQQGFVWNGTGMVAQRGTTNGTYMIPVDASGNNIAFSTGMAVAAKYNSTLPTVANGSQQQLQMGTRGSLNVTVMGQDSTTSADVAVQADNVNSAVGGMMVTARASKYNGNSWDRDVKPNATARLLSAAASTNGTNVKASAGNVTKITGTNTNAAKRYLKLYNKATTPTVGTDTPVQTFELPPNTVNGGQFSIDIPNGGYYFGTGIGYGLTTAAADNDTGALTAGDVTCLNIIYS
jgi:hypothetical protein